MPRYKVLKKGFINDTMHKPGHPKHGYVYTDKPLKPVPSWLKLIKEETPAQKKKREAAEEKAEVEAAKKAEQDKIDKDSVTFTEDPKQSQVETL